ncbi:hypothetical protein CC85DRAFT_292094 [Cutaneotrichosporon oleaginosum]|uniref:Uncharacterized protein n=1 Tax=Cutaneotrichosporon oleaginosum TaxID=879819 RepID=A0A0J1B484_9TREE|nr:uncharacterized protein CC85DRAFT_292094 [Cutaneotrichosporon oleaginosum]KLT42454.1 hypothetical protein CC85DRAFT_292094 [Cutaneotrichosporon oleaginosum]TXT06973.1 hypothetical protein COLE_06304 [Cutaneotrichosporon oleaginosum]
MDSVSIATGSMVSSIPNGQRPTAKDNLRLLSSPNRYQDTGTPLAPSTLDLAEETARLYPRHAFNHYVDPLQPPLLPIGAYSIDPKIHPNLARVATAVSTRRSSAANLDCLYQSAQVVEGNAPAPGPTKDTIDHRGEQYTIGANDAAGIQRMGPATCSSGGAREQRNERPLKRPRTTSGAGGSPRSLQTAPTIAYPFDGHVPVIAGMVGKRPCPQAPPGQRHTVAYQKAVSEWIAERTSRGTKLNDAEHDKLLVANFMTGKMFFRHPLNVDYDESTNLDPELWSNYTEWGKTLVPEAVIFNRLSTEEKESLHDWPDRDLWKALFLIWLRDYCDRHTRVVWYRQCFRCQRGGWPCMVSHEMFGKVDVRHKRGKAGQAAKGCACIPCRVSKAECSHPRLKERLQESTWAMSDLEAYWDGTMSLTELFERRQRPEAEVGPFDADAIDNSVDKQEDDEFDVLAKLESQGQKLPTMAPRKTLTRFQRGAREARASRRADRAKALAGERETDSKKLVMVQYLASRLREGTLTSPMYPWKEYDKTIRDLSASNARRRAAGEGSLAPEDVAPYTDFYSLWLNGAPLNAHVAFSHQIAVAGPSAAPAQRRSGSRSSKTITSTSDSSALHSSPPLSLYQLEPTPALVGSRSSSSPASAINTPDTIHSHLHPSETAACPHEYFPAGGEGSRQLEELAPDLGRRSARIKRPRLQ